MIYSRFSRGKVIAYYKKMTKARKNPTDIQILNSIPRRERQRDPVFKIKNIVLEMYIEF